MAEQVWNDRPPVATQFPSKYAYLPDINSPRPPDRSLVPVNGRKQSPAGYNPNLDLDADERIRQLEVRLNVAEKSNRALLEEVLRLQGDIKTANRRNDEVLREEKGSRHNLESAMKINNELITQLSARIKEAEDKLSEEKSALSSLVNHTKGVEQAVKSSQNELIAKKDIQSQKLVEMRAEMEELQGAKNQLERICFSMADDVRTLKMKVDQQSAEIGTVSSDMRNRSKKLEDDNRNQLDTLRKTSTIQSQTEQQTTQLRGQVETRLSELRDVLVDVRAKQESELNERRTLEQQMSKKIYELQQALSEANRRRDEGMHTMDIILREKDHANQADKLNLTSKVADTVEDVNKRLLSKEIKMREEMQERYLQLERLIQQEQQNRRDAERAMREDIDRKFLTLKHATEELNLDIKEQLKNEKVKTKETVAKLDESISIVEKQSAENKKQFEKVMGAEISQRKMHEASTIEKLASVNEKLQIATSSLQQSIGGITQVMNSQNEKMKREIRGMMSEQKEASTRAMTDLDARMGYMKTRMNEFEDKLEARVATATAVLSQNLREKVDAISIWQDTTQQTIKELSTNLTKLPEELYALQEKQTLMKTDMDSRFTSESEARSREIELLKAELETMKERHSPLPATKSDLDNLAAEVSSDPQVQGSVRKLADSIQTVKTVLGMKIQSEQKLRVSGLENLQVQVNQIKANVGVGNIYSGQPDYRNDNGLDTGLGSWDDPTPHTSSSKNPNSSADQYPSTSRNDGKDTNTQMGTIPESGDTSRKTPVSPSKGGKTKSPANSRTVTPSKSRNVTPSQSRNNTPTQPSRNVTPNTGRNKKSPTPSTGKTGNNTARDGDQTNRQDGNKTPKGGNDTARDGNQTDRDGNQPIMKKPIGKNFVKGRGNAEDVNKWNVANAYRWSKWKSRLTYILWKVRQQKENSNTHGQTSSSVNPSESDQFRTTCKPGPGLNRNKTRDSGLEEDIQDSSDDSGGGLLGKFKPKAPKTYESTDSDAPPAKPAAKQYNTDSDDDSEKPAAKKAQKKVTEESDSDSEAPAKKKAPSAKKKKRQKKKPIQAEVGQVDVHEAEEGPGQGLEVDQEVLGDPQEDGVERQADLGIGADQGDRLRGEEVDHVIDLEGAVERQADHVVVRQVVVETERLIDHAAGLEEEADLLGGLGHVEEAELPNGLDHEGGLVEEAGHLNGLVIEAESPKRKKTPKKKKKKEKEPSTEEEEEEEEKPKKKKKKKKETPKKKKKNDKEDPWKANEYDEKEKEKRQKEKEQRMPTESEPDSEDSVEFRKKSRAARNKPYDEV
uniref:Uncharacterized protein n=1 Tax=Magallana gigas TaxID=29159 RepID=A0A8W8MNL5_MAGGI